MERRRGHLFVISGPSGAGKSTLRKKLLERFPDLVYSVSYTTRLPRPGEREGWDYRFVDEDKFRKLVREGKFLEWAQVHGNLYGTNREDVEKALEEGCDVILEIDVQGASQVKRQMPESVLIFVMPPSETALEERLLSRGSEAPEAIKVRLDNAQKEMASAADYDHVVVNDDINKAVDKLATIIAQYRRPER